MRPETEPPVDDPVLSALTHVQGQLCSLQQRFTAQEDLLKKQAWQIDALSRKGTKAALTAEEEAVGILTFWKGDPPSLAEIARMVGVDRSTVSRWTKLRIIHDRMTELARRADASMRQAKAVTSSGGFDATLDDLPTVAHATP